VVVSVFLLVVGMGVGVFLVVVGVVRVVVVVVVCAFVTNTVFTDSADVLGPDDTAPGATDEFDAGVCCVCAIVVVVVGVVVGVAGVCGCGGCMCVCCGCCCVCGRGSCSRCKFHCKYGCSISPWKCL